MMARGTDGKNHQPPPRVLQLATPGFKPRLFR